MNTKKLKYLARKLHKKIASMQGYILLPEANICGPVSSLNLSDESKDYLRFDNSRLVDLVLRYDNISSDVTVPVVWKDGIIDEQALKYFRGENAYVWQNRSGNTEINYALTTYYAMSKDRNGLLDSLGEDDAFGVSSFTVSGKKISRDLLDSILEMEFLNKHLSIFNKDEFSVLDIGAGYGRLAHRMCKAVKNIKAYYCVDAVPISTFLCEYYVKFRNVENKAHVVPLDELDTLRDKSIDLAINIHSFSECSLAAIEWWCKYISELKIRHLMIAPNPGNNGGKKLTTTPGDHEFQSIVEKYGYKLIAKEAKFDDPSLQRGGLFPTYYYLFELA